MKPVIDTVQRAGKGEKERNVIRNGSSEGIGDKGIRLIFTSATSALFLPPALSRMKLQAPMCSRPRVTVG